MRQQQQKLYYDSTVKKIIEQDGKFLKYVGTDGTQRKSTGRYFDHYIDDEKKIYFVPRLANNIRFSTHSRFTGDGNMISFSVNFTQLLKGLSANCDDKELSRLINTCIYPLERAKSFYVKENPETAEETFTKAVNDKVSETIDIVSMKDYSQEFINGIERAMKEQSLKDLSVFYTALCHKLSEIESTNTSNNEDESSI